MGKENKSIRMYEMLTLHDGNLFRRITTDPSTLTPIMKECLDRRINFRIVSIPFDVEMNIETSETWGWRWKGSIDDPLAFPPNNSDIGEE